VLVPERDPFFFAMVNPSPEKALIFIAPLLEQASVRRPDIPFWVVESRGTAGLLASAAVARGFDLRRHENIMVSAAVARPRELYAATRVLLAPSVSEEASRPRWPGIVDPWNSRNCQPPGRPERDAPRRRVRAAHPGRRHSHVETVQRRLSRGSNWCSGWRTMRLSIKTRPPAQCLPLDTWTSLKPFCGAAASLLQPIPLASGGDLIERLDHLRRLVGPHLLPMRGRCLVRPVR